MRILSGSEKNTRQGSNPVVWVLGAFVMLICSRVSVAQDNALAPAQKIRAIYERIQHIYREHEARLESSTQTEVSENPSIDSNRASIDAEDEAVMRFFEGEELLVTVYANKIPRGTVLGIVSKTGIRFGLGELSDVLEFPINYSEVPLFATGWYFRPSKKFELRQLPDGGLEVSAGAKDHALDASRFALTDDLYVELADLAQWFGLDFKFDEAEMKISFESQEKFPIQMRMARQGKQPSAQGRLQPQYPIKKPEYQLWSPPLIDVQAASSVSDRKNKNGSSSMSRSSNYSVLGNQDIAYFNSEFFLAGNDIDALSSARLTLSKRSPEAALLGPMYATTLSVGDVVPVKGVGGVTQNLSRGAVISNRPIGQLSNNETVNLVGEVQSGWDVELYRNGVLIAQQLNVTDGRYEFNDTPLIFGVNDFELVLYGPQGQRQSRTESYLVNQNAVDTNQAVYQVSVVQLGKTLLGVDEDVVSENGNGLMISSLLNYGVNDFLSVNAGHAQVNPQSGSNVAAYSLGANLNLGSFGLLNSRISWPNDSSRSLSLSYRTRWRNTSYSVRFNDSQALGATEFEEQDRQRLEASMSGRVRLSFMPDILFQNSWQQEIRKSALDGTRFETSRNAKNVIGLRGRWGNISHGLTWRDLAPDGFNAEPLPDDFSLLGSLVYRKGFGHFYTRFATNYAFKPYNELLSVAAVVDYSWYNGSNIQFRYDYAFAEEAQRAGLRINWALDEIQLNTNATYLDDGSWYAGAGFRFSFGYDPLGKQLFGSRRSLSQYGNVAVRVFEDLNSNLIYDDNEPFLEDAEIKAVQAHRSEKTSASGSTVIKSLYNDTETDIVVEPFVRDGAYMITASQGVAIKSRKGFLDRVEIPVVKAGELEGFVYLNGDGNSDNDNDVAPYVNLNLINEDNQVVATTRTEFDGFYLFTDLKPGRYRLKVDDQYAFRKALKSDPIPVEFSNKGDVITDADLVLREMDDAEGFIAKVGYFQNPGMLKLYYLFLSKRINYQFPQKPFYIRERSKGGYTLSFAYHASDDPEDAAARRKARLLCDAMQARNIPCTVEYRNFKY